ncbi:SusC/RagA family TonB-linked outer membrane protein [Marinifilum sp. D737]|uniref:SusC/RagA family TonB-linked outer membrane protein n=1 Tax=Marinifilum sp. D737 TaxID=2969628 RepID=UPI002273D2ED|nr:SusC/RagA family TonB-linked outer membrane protein [Marinifilum sp. D737]MCY1636552.1 SusC/RagA family TonB-linked outer membrane protein [Marinifilum sp. D737]
MKKNLTTLFHNWGRAKTRQWLMRLTVLKMILLMSLLTSYGRVNSQMIISNLKLQEVDLSEALVKIEEQTDYDFVFSYDDVQGYKVTVDLQSASLEECLNAVLHELPFEYITEDDVVIVSYKKPEAVIEVEQEKKELKGKVTDKDGIPLPGVSIYINMTSIGTTTDVDGYYSIKVPENGVIIVYSFIGLQTKEVIYKGQEVINVVLHSDEASLEEVVVTGFQTISKERATGSYVKLSSEDFEKVITPSITDQLEGNVVGLNIDKKGNIIVRGTSTFKSNTTPLVVVDGFPIEGGLESINPLDIESVTVLKDAVSASIYGVNSANGIIVVTTKKGKKGQLNVDFTYNLSVKNKQDLGGLERMNTSEAIDFQKELLDKGHYSIYMTPDSKNYLNKLAEIEYRKQFEGLTDEEALALEAELRAIPNDAVEKQYEDYFLRKAVYQQANLSIRGASDNANYSLSLKADKDISGLKYNSGNKYFIDGKYSFDVSDKIKLALGISVNKTDYTNNSPFNTSDYVNGAHPFELLKNNGQLQRVGGIGYPYLSLIKDNPLFQQSHAFYNPITQIGTIDNVQNSDLNRYQVQLDYEPIQGLNLRLMYQNESAKSRNLRLLSPENYDQARVINNNTIVNSDGSYNQVLKGLSGYSFSNNKVDFNLFRGVLNFKKLYKEDHYFTALGGFEYSIREDDAKSVANSLFDTNNGAKRFVSELYNTSWQSPFFPDRIQNRPIGVRDENTDKLYTRQFLSLFSNFAYSYKSKYNFTGSVRVDQGNIYSKDSENKYKPLWSLGASWNLHEEDFFKGLNSKIIDRFNLKASYGITGQINKGETALTVKMYPGIYGSDQVQNNKVPYGSLSYPNINFKWEETKYTNIGVDYSLFKGALVGGVEYFNKHTVDLANNVAIDPTNGATSMLNNNAELSNKGVDIYCRGRILDGDFKWTSDLNFSHLKSKILKFERAEADSIVLLGTAMRKGYAMGTVFAYDYAGLDENGYALIRRKDGAIVSSDQVITDINRVLSADDLVNVGTTIPKYTGGFNNTFSYKGLSLRVNIIYEFGHVMHTNSFGSIINYTQGAYYPEFLKNRWTPNNTNTNIPKLISHSDIKGGYSSRFYNDGSDNYVDASNIRLRRIALNYQLPKNVVSKLKIASASLNLQVANLGPIWLANDLGIDPRYNFSGKRGLKNPTEYSLGVNLKF